MPNIILTEYCNLQCPYCFANKMITDAYESSEKNITIQQLDRILKWLTPTAASEEFSIGLIGGEPLLHPQFDLILQKINNFCSMTKSNSIIFTNGLLLDKYINQIGEQMSILINVNKLNQNFTKTLINNLKLVDSLNWFNTRKVTLGCNLYLQEDNYDFFWNIVDQFLGKIHIVRMSVTAPNDEKLKLNKELYYNSMKNICLDFLKEAQKRGIEISYDCNQIPLCFFSEEEQFLINSLGERHPFCEPVIDITPDFHATCCFGVYNTPISCNLFNNVNELKKYFNSLITLKMLKNNNSLCKNCEKIQYMQCQGGCLSFSSLAKDFNLLS